MTKSLLLALSLTFLCAPASAARMMKPYDTPRNVEGFALPSTDGKTRQLSDYQGRYVLINFWAVWCGPCRVEMPSMQNAYEKLKSDQFDMLAIHVGPSLTEAKTFADKLKLKFPILIDDNMNLSSWQVKGLPTTYLMNPNGQIIAEAVGDREWDSPELLQQIQRYLQQP